MFNSSFLGNRLTPIPLENLKEADDFNTFAFKNLAEKNEFVIQKNESWWSIKGFLIISSFVGNLTLSLIIIYLFWRNK